MGPLLQEEGRLSVAIAQNRFNGARPPSLTICSIILTTDYIFVYNFKREEEIKMGLFQRSKNVSTDKESYQTDYIKKDGAEQRGNTTGNIVNDGNAAGQGEWIYYFDCDDFILYKMRTDGSSETLIKQVFGWYFNVVGDWIYYSSCIETDRSIYKMRTDGSDVIKLNNEKCARSVTVVGDWIYYINESDSDKLYKMRTDGSEKIKLNNDVNREVNVVGDWIYYINKSNGNTPHKIRTDGSGKTKLNNDNCFHLIVFDDWIYCTLNGNVGDKVKIYKMRTDGKDKTTIIRDGASKINVDNGWVYYVNDCDNFSLYKIRTDGSDRIKLIDKPCGNMSIVGEWIFYNKDVDTGDFRTYKMNTTRR